MDASQWFTLAGGACELIGLTMVGIGITNTRRAFTERPPVAAKFLRVARRLLRIKERPVTLDIHSSVVGVSSTAARLSITRNWEGLDVEERLRRLQALITEHEEMIDQLFERLNQEERERQQANHAERTERQSLYNDLEARIREAAAGGLTQETVGVTLFIFGVILATIGGVIQPSA
jgi:hypothetical protein